MHWILQNNLFNESEWTSLVGVLERFKIPYSVHKVIPFIGELVPPAEPRHPKVICYGSYSMRHTAREHRWDPGVYDLFDQNFLVQKQHWGDWLLNGDAVVSKFKDAAFTEPDMFVRPIDDSKYFAGRVFSEEEFNAWQVKVCVLHENYGNSLTGDTLIQLCKPKKIYSEYRFWVADGVILTASMYKRGDRVIYSSEVDDRFYQFVGEVIRHWTIHRAYVIDVCETPDGIFIMEPNTINSSGLYAGDVTDIVMGLENLEN